MSCPNCGGPTWDDNLHWGCDAGCGWSSLAGLNKTRTPSAPYSAEPDHTEIEARRRDWARKDQEDAARRRARR